MVEPVLIDLAHLRGCFKIHQLRLKTPNRFYKDWNAGVFCQSAQSMPDDGCVRLVEHLIQQAGLIKVQQYRVVCRLPKLTQNISARKRYLIQHFKALFRVLVLVPELQAFDFITGLYLIDSAHNFCCAFSHESEIEFVIASGTRFCCFEAEQIHTFFGNNR